MSRTPVRLLVALLVLSGFATIATAQTDCPEDRSEEVMIAVASDASADPDCVVVKKGNAEIVWSGSDEVKTVVIKFDRDANPDAPEDPDCSGATCTLNKAKQALKKGEFAYFVWVENQDGSTAGKDPVLIIKP